MNQKTLTQVRFEDTVYAVTAARSLWIAGIAVLMCIGD